MTIGIIATILITCGYFPQCYRIFKTNNVNGLSLKTFITIFAGLLLWTIYAISNRDYPLMISSALSCIQVGYICTKIYINIWR